MDDGTNTSQLALVVVTRDRASLFGRYLLPSLQQLQPREADVVVVDQSAGNATLELVRELPWIRYLRGEPGLSRGRNLGIASTKGEIAVFTDDDVEFGPDWLPQIRGLFDDPSVGVVCGRGIDSDGQPLPYRDAGIYRWPTNPFSVGHGFNIAFRRKALDEAGPFDEGLGAGSSVPAAEDTDMIYRVMRSGWALRCDDRITVRHYDWRTDAQERAKHQAYGKGFAVQTLKHARAGDTTAVKIASRDVGRHVAWIVRALLRRDRRSLCHQRAWLRGAIAGATSGLRSGAGSTGAPPERSGR
jgi:GT2 family glycosyltransferase